MIFENYLDSRVHINIGTNTKYTPGTGFAEALIESAQNDLAMFRAMLDSDARELQMVQESAYTGEIMVFQEATGGGIFHKIAEFFKKLGEKIKGIFANFLARLRGLYMKDKDLVKKYEKEVLRKNLTDCTFKWSKMKHYPIYNINLIAIPSDKELLNKGSIDDFVTGDNTDNTKAIETILKEKSEIGKLIGSVDNSSYEEDYHNECFEDEDSSTDYKDLGITIREICSYLTDYSKKEKEMKKNVRDLEKDIEKVVKKFEDLSRDMYKDIKDDNLTTQGWNDKYSGRIDADADTNTDKVTFAYPMANVKANELSKGYNSEARFNNADRAYKKAQVYQSAILKDNACFLREMQFEHKQIKAAFMRAVTYRVKEEAFSFALAEAAADEVENIYIS